VKVFDVHTCKCFHTFTGKNSFTQCSFLKENLIAVGDINGQISLYDLRDGESTVREFDCQSNQVTSLVSYQNFSFLASGSINNSIYLFSLADGEKIDELKGHTGSVRSICEVDDQLISGSDDGTIKFWKI
jgi:WD40 repeat protein